MYGDILGTCEGLPLLAEHYSDKGYTERTMPGVWAHLPSLDQRNRGEQQGTARQVRGEIRGTGKCRSS